MPMIKSIRFADDLVADIEDEMKGSDRSFSYVVQRRCRADAWRGGNPIQTMPDERRRRSNARELAMERQRRLNEGKS